MSEEHEHSRYKQNHVSKSCLIAKTKMLRVIRVPPLAGSKGFPNFFLKQKKHISVLLFLFELAFV